MVSLEMGLPVQGQGHAILTFWTRTVKLVKIGHCKWWISFLLALQGGINLVSSDRGRFYLSADI